MLYQIIIALSTISTAYAAQCIDRTKQADPRNLTLRLKVPNSGKCAVPQGDIMVLGDCTSPESVFQLNNGTLLGNVNGQSLPFRGAKDHIFNGFFLASKFPPKPSSFFGRTGFFLDDQGFMKPFRPGRFCGSCITEINGRMVIKFGLCGNDDLHGEIISTNGQGTAPTPAAKDTKKATKVTGTPAKQTKAAEPKKKQDGKQAKGVAGKKNATDAGKKENTTAAVNISKFQTTVNLGNTTSGPLSRNDIFTFCETFRQLCRDIAQLECGRRAIECRQKIGQAGKLDSQLAEQTFLLFPTQKQFDTAKQELLTGKSSSDGSDKSGQNLFRLNSPFLTGIVPQCGQQAANSVCTTAKDGSVGHRQALRRVCQTMVNFCGFKKLDNCQQKFDQCKSTVALDMNPDNPKNIFGFSDAQIKEIMANPQLIDRSK